jgi:hypothetical protein
VKNRILAVVFVAAALPGCNGGAEPPAAANRKSMPPSDWIAPTQYEFEFSSSCGERSLIGRFHVLVKGGRAKRARGLDEPGRAFVASEEKVPTLDDLLAEADGARRDGAEIVDIRYDDTDGHPTQIDIDYDESAIDDEACYSVTAYSDLTM